MSNTLIEDASKVSAAKLRVSPTFRLSQLAEKASVSPWGWLAVTCLFLSISGGIRLWRELQFRSLVLESKASPFPLSEIPKELGSWHAVEGSDTGLDPETARVAGSSDHIIRCYTDYKTGETVSILVLYGLASSVFAHTPDVCYPAAGYIPKTAVDRELSLPGSATLVRFRASLFVKTVAGLSQYREVLCTFFHNGTWLPEGASRWKMFRYHPGMFKIQIERITSELSSEGSPSESLLKAVAQVIESRVPRIPNPK